jgi:lipopolysaccharide biosynthesis protein
MKRLGIYSSNGPADGHFVDDYQFFAVSEIRKIVDVLFVVTALSESSDSFEVVNGVADFIRRPVRQFLWTGEGYRQVLLSLTQEELQRYDEILLFDSTFFGPILPINRIFERMKDKQCDYWSATQFETQLDRRFNGGFDHLSVPNWNFLLIRKPVFIHPGFAKFWNDLQESNDYWNSFVNQEIGFAKFLKQSDFVAGTYLDPSALKTSDPRIYEAHKLIELGCPIVERAHFTLDPVVQDMQALQSRRTIELIKQKTDYDTGLIWRLLLRTQKLRDVHASLDLVSVLPLERTLNKRKKWKFGRIAILAHIYYPEMIDDFIARFESIPVPFDLFVTTATAESQKHIRSRLKALKRGDVDVRVVAHNRGRDMSSLFISLRDVVLSGKYELALRLHSKKTPQVSPHISATFTDHLVENLIPNKEYVANLFDIIDDNPNIGLVIPPVIHIGFGTLGHSWFNNREAFAKVAQRLDIKGPFDDHTPVAPYGTMYWFRCAALKPMFEHEWKWEDYNEEPNHVDGGLAHIQERLIAYVAQSAGYRTETVLATHMAGRYYAKLEYKLQLLASCFPNAMIANQVAIAQADQKTRAANGTDRNFAKSVSRFDKNLRSKHPRLWTLSRPLAKVIWPVVKKLYGVPKPS